MGGGGWPSDLGRSELCFTVPTDVRCSAYLSYVCLVRPDQEQLKCARREVPRSAEMGKGRQTVTHTPQAISQRIKAAIVVDRLFSDYLIEITPVEAVEFSKVVPSLDHCNQEQFLSLIQRANKLMPQSIRPERKAAPHSFRIGRDANRRIVYLRFSISNFPRHYSFSALLKVLEKYAQDAGALYQVQTDEGWFEILFWWI
jgi:hypothetical protein